MTRVRTHSSVRLRLQGDGNGRWVAYQLARRKRFRLPHAAVLLLLVCLDWVEDAEAIRQVAKRISLEEESVTALLGDLKARHLVVAGGAMPDAAVPQQRLFSILGWEAASDYITLTYDYPFVDYAADAHQIDHSRMVSYNAVESDGNRSKRHTSAIRRIPLPRPDSDLIDVSGTLSWSDEGQAQCWTFDHLARLLSIAFGQIGSIPLPWKNASPVYLKTSPSLGARHPTEAYVAVRDVPGLAAGWYHVCVADHTLDCLRAGTPGLESAWRFWQDAASERTRPRAVMLLTAVFERSMFRYREPHTFRSVHLDVGHLCSSIALLAAALGIRAECSNGPNEEQIEHELGVRGLTEGLMAAIPLW